MCFILIAGWTAVAAAVEWKPQAVRQLNGAVPEIRIPAKLQIVTEQWNRVVAVPYLVYMPEKDRLLMLVNCDYGPKLKPAHYAMVMSSDDRGTTWTKPNYLHVDAKGKSDAGLCTGLTYLGQGKVVAFGSDRRWFSRDYGASWSDLSPLGPTPDGKRWYVWDPMLVERNAQTGAVTRLVETGYTVSSPGHQRGYLRFSADEGRTWGDGVRVPQWEGVSEVALLRAQNGDLVAACRTDPPARIKGTIDHYGGLGVSISNDRGATWSEVRKLYDWGRHHPSMLLMPNHDIVMTYVVRKGYVDTPDGYPQFGIEAVVSHDNGQTWDIDHRYLLHTWAGNRKGSNEDRPGPQAWWASSQATSSVLLPDGAIITAFGTGYRSQPGPPGQEHLFRPRDVGLVLWQLGNQPLDDDRTIRDAPFDSDIRNVLDPATGKHGLAISQKEREPISAAHAGDVLASLELGQVKVGGEIGRRIDVTVNNNLLVLDAEKDFLAAFRDKTTPGGYGAYTGLGKLIDSAVRFAVYTKNEKVIALKKHLVEETIKAQEPDGYIGMMAAPDRMRGLWDVHEMGYIIFGLTSDYRYFGEKRSLEAAKKTADYILQHWATLPADWPKQIRGDGGLRGVATDMAATGLERTLLTLYRETGDQRYLDFCTRQRALSEWNLGIVIGRRDLLEGHIYAYLARCLAQLELYRLQPDEKLLRPTRRVLHFQTARDGMGITGAGGQWECWTDDQDGRGAVQETCATVYQLFVYDSLLRLEGKPRYGDLIERTVYNTLFAAQSPDGRRIRYYTPLEGNRIYHPGDNYCCPCNYRRAIANLPTMVYYRSGAGVAVSLYTPSEATIELAGGVSLNIRQETDYPTSGHVVVRLDPSKPATFPLQLRIPRWCNKAAVAINGQPWEKPIVSGAFLTIERQWTAGDQVTLDMPMTWRLVLGRKRQSGRAAVMRGPVVFCLNPARQDSPRNQDAADLTRIMLDPTSLKDLPSNAVRPGGMACAVRAGREGYAMGVAGDLSLRLTEFPDPQGKCVYFRLPDLSAAVPDELLGDE